MEERESSSGAESKIGVIAIVSDQTSIKEFKARQVEINAAEFQKWLKKEGGQLIQALSLQLLKVDVCQGNWRKHTTKKDADEAAWVFESDESTNAVSIFK